MTPTNISVLCWLQTALGLMWSYSAACRVRYMNDRTRFQVKYAMACFGAGGLFFSAAGWVGTAYGHLFLAFAGASIVFAQWATRRLWIFGPPRALQIDDDGLDHTNPPSEHAHEFDHHGPQPELTNDARYLP